MGEMLLMSMTSSNMWDGQDMGETLCTMTSSNMLGWTDMGETQCL